MTLSVRRLVPWLVTMVVTSASTATAQQTATLQVPPGAHAARRAPAVANHAVLDCATHGVWSPPPGWRAFELGRGITLAMSPTSGAALVRGSLRSRAERSIVATAVDAMVGSHVALPTPSGGRVDTVVAASIASEHVDVRWIQRGDALWIAVVTAHEASASSAIDTARASYLQLVDHACACGYDCERRPH